MDSRDTGIPRAHEPIQVVLVDEHAIVRAGMRTMLENDWGMEVIGEADSLSDAVSCCRRHQPDVVLLDLDVPMPDVVADVQALQRSCPDSALVVLGHLDDDDQIFRAMVAGVAGHVPDDAQPEELASTIRRAAHGQEPIGDALAQRPLLGERVLETFRDMSRDVEQEQEVPLSERELAILRHVAEGLTNRQIGRTMALSEHTIKGHMSSILTRFELKHRTGAVVLAIRRGWLTIPADTADD